MQRKSADLRKLLSNYARPGHLEKTNLNKELAEHMLHLSTYPRKKWQELAENGDDGTIVKYNGEPIFSEWAELAALIADLMPFSSR